MIKNLLRFSLRNLWQNKFQSAILIGGLTLGMATCILLLQYVNYELSFDRFHSDYNNIYRVVNERFQNGKSVQKGTITYPTIGPTMKEEFPEIQQSTRIAYSSDFMLTIDDQIEPIEPGLWVDEYFFEIFDFKLLAKDGVKILDQPNQVVLTQDMADRFFPLAKGDYQSIIGQELMIDRDPDPYRIVAVCENVPANSHLQFDILGSYASIIRYWGEGVDVSWTWSDFYHYIKVNPGTNPRDLETKFSDFSERHFRGTEVSGSEEIFTLQPLAEAHLYSADLEYEIGQTANGRAIWALMIIALFILTIAWINYVNLSSVRAIERAKEVGVRKVIGATKLQLIRQFIGEALVVNLISLLLALGVVLLLQPWFATNFGISTDVLSFFADNQVNFGLLAIFLSLIIGGVLLSGIYPALLLSSSHLSSVLKGQFNKDRGGALLRKGLVVFQFTTSIALISATWLVSKQISYMSKSDLGIKVDQIMTVNSPEMSQWDSTFIDRMNTFKADLSKFSGINSATTSSRAPGQRMGRIFQIRKSGEGEDAQAFTSNFINVDFEYATTYDLEPAAGRFFRVTDHNNDFNAIENIVISESAVKMLGYKNNDDAVNQSINFYDKDWRIIGVLPDFHQRSFHHSIEPIVFLPTYSPGNLLSLNISGENIDQTINHIRNTYSAFFPGNTFQYEFLDERFQLLYDADRRFGNILSFFTLLTILIACLGLFGLAAYTTVLRTKEIGVRKVLGATTASIVALLSIDFLKLVVLALIIATPLTYYIVQLWLQDFAYNIGLPWWIFLLGGLIALGIAFLTVSFQSIKAAIANPVDAIKNE